MTTALVAIASFYGGLVFGLVLVALLGAAAKGDRRAAEEQIRVYRTPRRARLPACRD